MLEYNKDYSQALNYFINSIRLTLSNFDLKDINFYLDYVKALTKVEIRNLYEIALCLFYLDQKDLADIIIQVLVQNLNTKWEFYGNILSLYAINFSRDENLSQALYYINQTIDFFHTNLYFKNLPLCYYNRSRIKSHLNDSTYKDDLIVALNLSDLLSQDYIADVIKDKCKKFNISL